MGEIQRRSGIRTVADAAATQNTLVAGNGTAATPSGGTRTLVATTDQTTTTNAIAGLVAELNLVKADIASLIALVNGTA